MPDIEEAIIYVDANNFQGNLKDIYQKSRMSINLPRLLESIIQRERNTNLFQIRYYTGLFPKDSPQKTERAKGIAYLNHLSNLGVKVYTNNLEKNEIGLYNEVGIDLKIAADMATDLLQQRATKFYLLSNDRDYEPAFQLLHEIANHNKKNIETITLTCGNRNGPKSSRKLDIKPELIERHQEDLSEIIKKSLTTLVEEPEKALDASHYEIKHQEKNPEIKPSTRGAKVYIDLNSLGESACKKFNRKYLDIKLPSFLKDIVNQLDLKIKSVAAFVNVHTKENDLVAHVFTNALMDDLNRRGWEGNRLSYDYKNPIIGSQIAGPAGSTKIHAKLALPKRIDMQILRTVVIDILKGKADDITIVSNNKNLWPIADICENISRNAKSPITIRNIHIGKESIPGMTPYEYKQDAYTAIIDDVDRLKEAKGQAQEIITKDLQELQKILFNDLHEIAGFNIAIEPENAEGKFVGKSSHWCAMHDGEGGFSFFKNFPFELNANSEYQVNQGKLREVFQEPVRTLFRQR